MAQAGEGFGRHLFSRDVQHRVGRGGGAAAVGGGGQDCGGEPARPVRRRFHPAIFWPSVFVLKRTCTAVVAVVKRTNMIR